MTEQFERLLTSYERGALTRRQLLHAVAVLAAAPVGAAARQTTGSVMKGINLHHVNVRVSDVARSEAFYRRMFGWPPTRVIQGQDAHGFELPGGGLISLQKLDAPGRLDHFCIGVENFNSSRIVAAVGAAGVNSVRDAGYGDSVYFPDPDGVMVQVSAPDWRP